MHCNSLHIAIREGEGKDEAAVSEVVNGFSDFFVRNILNPVISIHYKFFKSRDICSFYDSFIHVRSYVHNPVLTYSVYALCVSAFFALVSLEDLDAKVDDVQLLTTIKLEVVAHLLVETLVCTEPRGIDTVFLAV